MNSPTSVCHNPAPVPKTSNANRLRKTAKRMVIILGVQNKSSPVDLFKTGLPELIRKLNSRPTPKFDFLFSQDDVLFLRELLAEDIVLMGKTLNIDLNKLWL